MRFEIETLGNDFIVLLVLLLLFFVFAPFGGGRRVWYIKGGRASRPIAAEKRTVWVGEAPFSRRKKKKNQKALFLSFKIFTID